ncbi:hypothetical protein BD770DRAFT_396044 [Pilaira anomala]|nr:hypothetical protein BD770DRAFT_396044 [Pilaira anomala]
MEVLPESPASLVLGNDFLTRSSAKIDLESSTLAVTYKRVTAKTPLSIIKTNGNEAPLTVPSGQNWLKFLQPIEDDDVSEVDYEENDSENSQAELNVIKDSTETINNDFFCHLGYFSDRKVISQKQEQTIIPPLTTTPVPLNLPRLKSNRHIEIDCLRVELER